MNKLEELTDFSDEELLKQLNHESDLAVFEVLYDRYETLVYNKCYSFVNSIEVAKDLTQDIFLKVYLNLSDFKFKSKFSTWLYSLVFNHCVNFINRNREQKISNNKVAIDDTDLSNSETTDYVENLYSETNLFNLKVKKLKLALNELDEEKRTLILLKYQYDVKVKELSKMNKCSESAIKMRLKRSRQDLINIYNKIDHG